MGISHSHSRVAFRGYAVVRFKLVPWNEKSSAYTASRDFHCQGRRYGAFYLLIADISLREKRKAVLIQLGTTHLQTSSLLRCI